MPLPRLQINRQEHNTVPVVDIYPASADMFLTLDRTQIEHHEHFPEYSHPFMES